MPLNPKDPNAEKEINRFSKGIEDFLDKVGKHSIQDVLNAGRTVLRKKPINSTEMLNRLVNEIDTPILQEMASDVVTVMTSWFEDPQVLCCLIQGILGLRWATTNKLSEDTDFLEWIDIVIAFIDLIIVFLTSGLKSLILFIPDLIKEIMTAVIGAILMILQTTLFALRDSLINEILEAIDSDALEDHIWAKCLPLVQLIEILKKYIHDYGMLARLFNLINGFIGKLFGVFDELRSKDFPANVKDLEFLYWFRDLLLKLKDATINFELCYLPQFDEVGSDTPIVTGVVPPGVTAGLGKGNKPNSNSNDIQGVTVAADGTILQDTAGLKANSIPLLTNSSIRGFLNKYYGYPLDVVDGLIVGATSADNIQGTNAPLNLNADCPNSPTPAEIVKWALRVRNRNI